MQTHLRNFEMHGRVCKLDRLEHLVFGFARVTSIDGRPVKDLDGNVIPADLLEESAYQFVLDFRTGAEKHQTDPDTGKVRKVADLIESCVFTPEKIQVMESSLRKQGINATINIPAVAWWIGMRVNDPDTWQKVELGQLGFFSLGGRALPAGDNE